MVPTSLKDVLCVYNAYLILFLFARLCLNYNLHYIFLCVTLFFFTQRRKAAKMWCVFKMRISFYFYLQGYV